MERLKQIDKDTFIKKMEAHVLQFWPNAVKEGSFNNIRELIVYSMDTAKSYDIEIEYDVGRFIDLVCALGKDFMLNPHYNDYKTILDNKQLIARERLDRLYEKLGINE